MSRLEKECWNGREMLKQGMPFEMNTTVEGAKEETTPAACDVRNVPRSKDSDLTHGARLMPTMNKTQIHRSTTTTKAKS